MGTSKTVVRFSHFRRVIVALLALSLSLSLRTARGGEKYLWAEPIAFDNAAADYGVAEISGRGDQPASPVLTAAVWGRGVRNV